MAGACSQTGAAMVTRHRLWHPENRFCCKFEQTLEPADLCDDLES